MSLQERLTKRFRGVTGVTEADIADWIGEAETESGLTAGDPDGNDNALLYLALSIAYSIIAADAARYFSYRDAEESIDKRGIAEEYRKLSEWARRQYAKQLRGGYGASGTYSARADAK